MRINVIDDDSIVLVLLSSVGDGRSSVARKRVIEERDTTNPNEIVFYIHVNVRDRPIDGVLGVLRLERIGSVALEWI